MIRRAFADLSWGQVHYRHGGAGRVLLLLHAGPGSAKQLAPLATALATDFRVIAPDMPGNGDSAPLDQAAPQIADYAAATLALLDTLGIEHFDIYGSHTGASVAAELAIRAPDRVGRIVMDGLGVFTPEQRDELLARYAHPFAPDLDGAYLSRAFMFLRDQYLFFPWYDRTPRGLRDGAALRPAEDLHDWLVELLKAAGTYHLAYRAAFAWPARDRLPLVTRPVLLTAAANDPLFAGSRDVATLLPDGRFTGLPRFDAPDFATARRALVTGFITAPI